MPRTAFDPTLPRNIADPYPDLQRVREQPVVVNKRLGLWMLGRYDDVSTAIRANNKLSSRDGIMLRSFVAGPQPLPEIVRWMGSAMQAYLRCDSIRAERPAVGQRSPVVSRRNVHCAQQPH